jgi:hypothetical protein
MLVRASGSYFRFISAHFGWDRAKETTLLPDLPFWDRPKAL